MILSRRQAGYQNGNGYNYGPNNGNQGGAYPTPYPRPTTSGFALTREPFAALGFACGPQLETPLRRCLFLIRRPRARPARRPWRAALRAALG